MASSASATATKTELKEKKASKADEAVSSKGLRDPKVTENAKRVLEARYLIKDEEGKMLEAPKDLFWRVAQHIASVEKEYGCDAATIQKSAEQFYHIMADGLFMPNSPTLMNAGREMGMLSACFVLPLEDSIEGIFSTVKATAMIQKAGGGTGFSFDKLRPTGDYISTSGGTTSGPISFWKVLSEATNAIQQGAFRRGANMGMMSITHPDILKFIQAKQDLSAFTNFNISVKVPNAWMEAYRKNPDAPHEVINRRTDARFVIPKDMDVQQSDIKALISLEDYNKMDENTRPTVWSSAEVFGLIIDCAWQTGEPGLIFNDHINNANPTPHVGEIEATNPCGEQPLLPYEACNLGSINLAKFVTSGNKGDASYDWDGLREAVNVSTRFLDNVIEANRYPLPEIEQMCKGNRKIGLGVMGFADALFKMGIPYNSEAGLDFGEKVMKFINDESHNASEKLADERGCFINWEGSTWQTKHNRKMRNAATTTVAPTGTISIIANCSGGVEPMFSLAFFRNVLNGQRLAEVNEVFADAAKEGEFYSDELIEKVAEEGTLAHIDGIPQEVKNVYVTAHDITPEWHTRMQAAFQKHCDSSISKTINLPRKATRDDVRKVYEMAWELNCKGVTIYRDGCREAQPMALSSKKKEEQPAAAAPAKKRQPAEFKPRKPIRTPSILSAVRIRQRSPFGHMHVTISIDPAHNRELEVFAQLGKAGDVAMSDLEAISRMVSLFLRMGGTLEQIIDQLEGIGSHMSIPTRDGRVMSLADGLGKTLRRYVEARKAYGITAILTGKVDFDKLPSLKESGDTLSVTPAAGIAPAPSASPNNGGNMDVFKIKCPECDGNLSFSEGCVKCYSCGYSQC